MTEFIHIKSIYQLHHLMEIEKPVHPLISVVRHSKDMKISFGNVRFNSDLYFISLKENIKGSFKYGRNSYDFKEGTLLFVAPGQVMSSNEDIEPDLAGWSVFFHPNLIRKSQLATTITKYHFFDYDIHEALHLSKKEKATLTECVLKIEQEINQNIDKHSQELIIHNLEAILKYGLRYYDRQFAIRTNQSKDYISKFETFLKNYFSQHQQIETGIPTVEICGKAMNMSGKYLSDLLKAETGKSLIEHIHLYIVDKSKAILLNSNLSVSEIAHSLGFNYPQHFSKLFKTKTGLSPSEYRHLN
ncbi:MAG: transcriptional regulator [Bacteroidetes bacterium GWF2_41_31]|nr:MAG: transcriptional regulator [Bacteroidetes bacterium GWF2_41_31]